MLNWTHSKLFLKTAISFQVFPWVNDWVDNTSVCVSIGLRSLFLCLSPCPHRGRSLIGFHRHWVYKSPRSTYLFLSDECRKYTRGWKIACFISSTVFQATGRAQQFQECTIRFLKQHYIILY